MSNPFKAPIDKNEKLDSLYKLEENLKRQIIFNEVDIRYLERQKVAIGDAKLVQLQEVLNQLKKANEEYTKKLEVIADIIKETK